MIKVAIILLILSVAMCFVERAVIYSLTAVERFGIDMYNVIPTRVMASTVIMVLTWVATAICGIIAIIQF